MQRALHGETGSNVEYMLRRKDTGETWWGSYNFGPIKDRDGKIVGAIVAGREITDRKKAEEALRRLNRELWAVSECNQAMVRATDESALMRDVCRIICDSAGYRMAWVGVAEHDAAKTVRPVAWGGNEDGYLANAAITWEDTERGRGPTGIAVRTGKTDFARILPPNLKQFRGVRQRSSGDSAPVSLYRSLMLTIRYSESSLCTLTSPMLSHLMKSDFWKNSPETCLMALKHYGIRNPFVRHVITWTT